MLKREVKRITNKYGKLFEPLAVFTLILIFTLPILTVINLRPQVISNLSNESNVLGARSNEPLAINKVGGLHNYIQNEKLVDISDGIYEYRASVLLREPGVYNKPIFEIRNPSSTIQKVEITMIDYEGTTTQFGLIINDVNYILRDSKGQITKRVFDLAPGQSEVFYLDVRNDTAINFHEKLGLRIRTFNPELESSQKLKVSFTFDDYNVQTDKEGFDIVEIERPDNIPTEESTDENIDDVATDEEELNLLTE